MENQASGTAWDPNSYEEHHAFVYEHGRSVVELLDIEPGARVLDVGCGTGQLTAQLADAGASVVGVDRAAEMLATARASSSSCAFVRGEATRLPVKQVFDAAFSNAALHWVQSADQGPLLESVHDALVPGGRFVAELGGTDNVRRIRDATRAALAERGYEMQEPWYFPSIGAYAGRLEAHGFEIRFARLFDRPTELGEGTDGLRVWLETFGERLFASVPHAQRDAVVSDVEDALWGELFRDGSWVADYRRLRFRAIRDD